MNFQLPFIENFKTLKWQPTNFKYLYWQYIKNVPSNCENQIEIGPAVILRLLNN